MRRHTELIDVAVPTFNDVETLLDTLASLDAQAVLPRCVAVVDDCSTDTTCDIAHRFADRLPIRITRNARNLGLVGNWNECIRVTEAPYVLILHSDDWLHPEAILRAAELVAQQDVGCASLGAQVFRSPQDAGDFNRTTQADGAWAVHMKGGAAVRASLSFMCSSVFCSRRLLSSIGAFDCRYPYSPDEELWVRIAAQSNVAEWKGTALVGVRGSGEHYMHETWQRPDFEQRWHELHDHLVTLVSDACTPEDALETIAKINQKRFETLKWVRSEMQRRGFTSGNSEFHQPLQARFRERVLRLVEWVSAFCRGAG